MSGESNPDLEKMIADGLPRAGDPEGQDKPFLMGHPAGALPSLAQDKEEKNKPDQSGTPSDKDEEKPDASAAQVQPGAAHEASGSDAKPKEDQSDNFRFRDHAAAEEGYRSQQAEVTKLQQRLATLESERNASEKAREQASSMADFESKMADISRKENLSALKKIDALNPDDKNYQDQVAEIWTQKDIAVTRWIDQNHWRSKLKGPAESAQDQKADADAIAAAGAAPRLDPWKFAKEAAVKAEIDPEDEFFIRACESVPSRDKNGKSRSLEDMVAQVIIDTKAYHTKIHDRFEQKKEKKAEQLAQRHQEASQPLGASSAKAPASDKQDRQDKKPVWIDDALAAVNQERRL